ARPGAGAVAAAEPAALARGDGGQPADGPLPCQARVVAGPVALVSPGDSQGAQPHGGRLDERHRGVGTAPLQCQPGRLNLHNALNTPLESKNVGHGEGIAVENSRGGTTRPRHTWSSSTPSEALHGPDQLGLAEAHPCSPIAWSWGQGSPIPWSSPEPSLMT